MNINPFLSKKRNDDRTASKNDLNSLRLSKKLSMRKSDLFNKIMAARVSLIEDPKVKMEEICEQNTFTFEEISFLLHNNKEVLSAKSISPEEVQIIDEISFGLFACNYNLMHNKFTNNDARFILNNIYYRILDIFYHSPQYQTIILKFMANFTQKCKFMTKALLKDDFLQFLGENFEKDFNKEFLVLLISFMDVDPSSFKFINQKFDVIQIILSSIEKYGFEEAVLGFIEAVYENYPRKKIRKLDKVSQIMITEIKKMSNLNDEKSNEISKYLLQILFYYVKDTKSIALTINGGIIGVIKVIISSKTSLLEHAYKLLSRLIKGDDEHKRAVLGDSSELPFLKELVYFVNELKAPINTKSTKLSTKITLQILKCINSLIKDSVFYTNQYFLNRQFLGLTKEFLLTCQEKIKSQTLILCTTATESNEEICGKIIEEGFCEAILLTLRESHPLGNFVYNCLCLLYNLLRYGQVKGEKEKTFNKVALRLEESGFKSFLDHYSDSYDEKQSEKAREIYIKFWSEPENYYEPSTMCVDN